MTKEEINQIILNHCGWEKVEGFRSGGEWITDGWSGPSFSSTPPDYCNSLVDIHKVLETLNADQLAIYAKNLESIHPSACFAFPDPNDYNDFWYTVGLLLVATPQKCAEALAWTFKEK